MARSLLRGERLPRSEKRAPDCRFAGRHPDCSREPVGRSGGGGRGGRDPLSPAGFELFSAEDGNKMTSIFETVAHHWKGGGFGMYPIALCLVFAVAVIIDRIQVLFFGASVDKEQFLRGLKTHIFNGDLDKAISYTAGQKATPLTNIVKAGLINVPKGEDEVQAAMDEASLREMPRIEKRTGYLAIIRNLPTPVALLRTIIGPIRSFPRLPGR